MSDPPPTKGKRKGGKAKQTKNVPQGDGGSLSLFPLRPTRQKNERPPGRVVLLITNLFRMSINTRKPIYEYPIHVDIVDQTQGDKNAEGKPPRKLSAAIRREALQKTVSSWVKDKKPKDYDTGLTFNYVFDANASVMYALFNMFPEGDKEKKKEFQVSLTLERFSKHEIEKIDETFIVRLTAPKEFDFEKLASFCRREGACDITTMQEFLRALNVIMRGKIYTIPTYVTTRFNVYPFRKENQFSLSPGVICNKGFSLSVRPTQTGIVLNVGNTVGAFLEEISLIDLLQQRFRVNDLSKPLREDISEKLLKEIRNKQVYAKHINYGSKNNPHYRKYRVTGIGGNSQNKFLLVDKVNKTTKEITIKEYFETEYKCRIKYPLLPCIEDKGRKIPLEVCCLVDKQRVSRRMDPQETSEIIKRAALKPKMHFEQVDTNRNEINKLDEPMKNFGLKIEPQPIVVEGRELTPIKLIAERQKEIQPNNGQYNVQREKFIKPAMVNKWVVAFLKDDTVVKHQDRLLQATTSTFNNLYCSGARQKGVSIANILAVHFIPSEKNLVLDDRTPERDFKNKLKQYFTFLNNSQVDHAIIVLNNRCPDWVYGYIQYVETLKYRTRENKCTRTSCVKFANYTGKILDNPSANNTFISNLWLKYNTKLGGVNFALKNDPSLTFLQNQYLFVSIDVCHPAPGDKLPQSVAAAVGMWDLTSPEMSYFTSIRVQRKTNSGQQSTKEDVDDIGLMVEEILDAYKSKKKALPAKVVILRDGVSEGQFKIVLEYELSKVKMSMLKKYTEYKVPIAAMSCLVVQKRHKVRFMLQQGLNTPKGPDFNIQPGTVVDSTIVHPTDFDFYLAPHKAIQGTSKAPHIYMILDEIGFSSDAAQAMIHALSYLSPRCTKSTSIPTPVNLADLAAERGKNIVIGWNADNPKAGSDDERLKRLNEHLANIGDSNYRRTLFYV